jgi:phenylpyruvate tautomerase PptA (4-oxalocrotonate tautomerase family)
MPLYTVHARRSTNDSKAQENFFRQIVELHCRTFGSDPGSIRVEFVEAQKAEHNAVYRYVSLPVYSKRR